MGGRFADGDVGLYQLCGACGRPTTECLGDPHAAVASCLQRHHGDVLFRHQFVEMDSVCLAGPFGHAQHEHFAGIAATSAARRLDRPARDPVHQSAMVLPMRVRRHVFDRQQAFMGQLCWVSSCCNGNAPVTRVR